MDEVNGSGADLLGFLLHRTLLRLRADAAKLLAQGPGVDFAMTGPGRVTVAHLRLLDRLPARGARASDLAAGMGVTKQALGQLVQQLADRGYVEIVADPEDRRAKLVCATPRGSRAIRHARNAASAVEQRWRAQVGTDRYAVFRAVLRELSG